MVGDRPAATARLHGGSPDTAFKIDLQADLSGQPLSIRIEEGRNGAIQDRVMIEGFVLLSNNSSQ